VFAVEVEARIRACCDAARWDDAIKLALEAYGPELLSYLVALVRSVGDADDVFGAVCEDLWRALPTFRWDSSLRTFAYTVARHRCLKHLARARRVSHVSLSSPSALIVVAELRSRTATYLRTETKDRIAQLRAQLEPEDQTLLILRVNRQLAWRDIARIMSGEGAAIDLDRRAAGLRKRFERLKSDLRAKACMT